MPDHQRSVAERFWEHVPLLLREPEECWEWSGAKSQGYGQIWYKGKQVGAHRLSWILHHGEPKSNRAYVLHACDTPSCVNPKHLYLGTHLDNMRDMRDRGRSGKCQGDDHGSAKVTRQQVHVIRQMWKPRAPENRIMAKTLGITSTQLANIANRRSWAHI